MKTRAQAASLIAVILFVVSFWYLLPHAPKEKPMAAHTWSIETFGTLEGIARSPATQPKSVVVLMHGYGSNEADLADLGESLLPGSVVVSLRAPLTLSSDAYAWFSTDFKKSPPLANSAEALASFDKIQQALIAIGDRYHVPDSHFAVMGFSQGAIMTIGLVLAGQRDYGAYIAFSGRTLPEFAKAAREGDQARLSRRPLLVFHGTRDATLPFTNAVQTQKIFESLHANFVFKTFDGGHTILPEEITEAKAWLTSLKLN